MPLPAERASASRSFLRKSSSVGSRFNSLSFAHPFLRSSDARSVLLNSAVPMSRGTSSLGGRECVDVNVTGLPTTSARRNSRDSKAQSWCASGNVHECVAGETAQRPRGTHLVLARRCAHPRRLNIREVQDTVWGERAQCLLAHDPSLNTRSHTALWGFGLGVRGFRAIGESHQRSRLVTP